MIDQTIRLGLMIARKVYAHSPWGSFPDRPQCIREPNEVAEIIRSRLLDDKPCMIARFGANELSAMVNYLGVRIRKRSVSEYIFENSPSWWWDEKVIDLMHTGAGFFPPQEDKLEEFSQLMIADTPQVDILGSWLPNERYFQNELKNAIKVQLLVLDPYWAKKPWTSALEGKKVLVVHPFTDTIKKQYKKREYLFENNLLPEFELKTVQAVQSVAGTKTPFADWFEALNFMKEEIDKIDYDICLIGAGAYGFPLAAHVKRQGKKAFHVGGSLQLLFGIRGRRWESPDYHHVYDYPGLVNQYWVTPSQKEKPKNSELVEGGCYW